MSNIKFTPDAGHLQSMVDWGELEPTGKWPIEYSFLTPCERPEDIPICAIRNGTYWIVSGKGKRKIYYHLNGVWATHKEDKLIHYCDLIEWNLLPSLRESEWKQMSLIPYKRLRPLWRDRVWAYKHSVDIRNLIMSVKKRF